VSGFFADGTVADLILLFMLLEGIVLAVYRQRTGRGMTLFDLAAMLLAGAFLLLALRAALIGASWSWIAVWLVGALVAHLVDLIRRWRV
jgi:hypothetical protein